MSAEHKNERRDQDVRKILNTILTSDSITKDMREEALRLHDSFEKTYKDAFLFNDRYYYYSDIQMCYDNSHTKDGSKKLAMMKELRNRFSLGVKDAKDLANALEHNKWCTYDC